MSFIKKLVTNAYYTFEGLTHQAKVQCNCSLFGQRFDLTLPAQKQRFIAKFRAIMWMTYRKGYRLSGPGQKVLDSDDGWGCTIRSGQMLLGQALRRQLLKMQIIDMRESLLNLIRTFIQDDSMFWVGKFSLTSIVKEAHLKWDYMAGNWMNPFQLSRTLQMLLAETKLQGYEMLEIETFNQVLYVDRVVEVLTGGLKCSCEDAKAICTNCHKLIRSVLILVCFSAGHPAITKQSVKALKSLMSAQSFLGMIGGKGGRAYYIVGYCERADECSVLYLDPHYCNQPYDFMDQKRLLSECVCNQPREVNILDLQPSLCASFLINQLGDLLNLLQILQAGKSELVHFEMHSDEFAASSTIQKTIFTSDLEVSSYLKSHHLKLQQI